MASHLIERLGWGIDSQQWQGYITFPSGRILEVFVDQPDEINYDSPEAPETFEAVQASSRPFILWFLQNEKELYDAVANEMIALYNENWSDEPPITADEFASRIEIISLSFQQDKGNFDLYFSDGEMEMFGGHTIVCSFDENGQFARHALWG